MTSKSAAHRDWARGTFDKNAAVLQLNTVRFCKLFALFEERGRLPDDLTRYLDMERGTHGKRGTFAKVVISA